MPRWLPWTVLLGLVLATWAVLGRRAADPGGSAPRASEAPGTSLLARDGDGAPAGPRLAVPEVGGARGAGGDATTGAGTLRGHVEDERGARVAGVEIAATPDAAPSIPAVRTTSRGDGTFELSVARGGLQLVEAHHGSGASRREARGWYAPGLDPHRIVLAEAPDLLKLEVVDEEGRPVPRFRARILPNGVSQEGVAGRAALRLSVLGEAPPEDLSGLRVLVWQAQDDAGVGLDLGAMLHTTAFRRDVPVRVVLPRLEALSGRVLDPSGQGLAGIAVTLTAEGWAAGEEARDPSWALPSGTSVWNGLVGRATTDAYGSFRIARVHAQAALVLEVISPGELVQLARVHLDPHEAPAPIHLRRAVTARVRVEGPEGPLAGASVVARVSSGLDPAASDGPVEALTDVQGHATLERLDPASRYQVHVSADDDPWFPRTWGPREQTEPEPAAGETDGARRPRLAPLAVAEWSPRDETFRLVRARPLRGRVLDSTGLPAARVLVGAAGKVIPGREWLHTDAAGRFEWAAPPAGPLHLTVRWDDRLDASLTHETVVEEAQRDGVLVRLPTGAVRILEVELGSATAETSGTPAPTTVWIWEDGGWSVTRACRTDWLPVAPDEGPLQRVRVIGLAPDVRARLTLLVPQAGFVDTELPAHGVARTRLEPGESLRLRLPEGVPADLPWWVAYRNHVLECEGCLVQAKARHLEVRGVPPGRWSVLLHSGTDAGTFELEAEADTASITDVPLPGVLAAEDPSAEPAAPR